MTAHPAIDRRAFLTGALAVAAACARPRPQPALDALRVAVIGVGGRGFDNLEAVSNAGARIVALCDCDSRQADRAFSAFPDAARHTDWRRLLERESSLEAVVVATPDHNHAIVAVHAMNAGKHVYCEKPLAHSIAEARAMARVAKERGLVTQMGTQGHAFEGTRRAVEVMRAGVLGDVTELHVWTDRPAGWWPQGVARPTDSPSIPSGLDWDVWLGPAPQRPYNPAYVPFKWRGFWDFGTGAIGDMGIHNLDTAFWGLELGAPTSVTVTDCSPALTEPTAKETAPVWSIIELVFPARGAKPPVKMTWYDGGKLPPAALFHGEPIISKDGGSLVVGSKGTLFTRTWHGGETDDDMFVLLPRQRFEGFKPPEPTLPRASNHHQEWVDACRGKGTTQSPFGYAAVLTESLLLGNVALRTGKSIEWDAATMEVRGDAAANAIVKPAFRSGWSL
jgi:predicted dehydrogenase